MNRVYYSAEKQSGNAKQVLNLQAKRLQVIISPSQRSGSRIEGCRSRLRQNF